MFFFFFFKGSPEKGSLDRNILNDVHQRVPNRNSCPIGNCAVTQPTALPAGIDVGALAYVFFPINCWEFVHPLKKGNAKEAGKR